MESYLIGEDLWKIVRGLDVEASQNTPENADGLKKRHMENAKTEYILKQSIAHGLFDHIISCKLAYDIWNTIYGLFNKKDVAHLQLLENELANSTQSDLFIFHFF